MSSTKYSSLRLESRETRDVINGCEFSLLSDSVTYEFVAATAALSADEETGSSNKGRVGALDSFALLFCIVVLSVCSTSLCVELSMSSITSGLWLVRSGERRVSGICDSVDEEIISSVGGVNSPITH